MEKYYCRSDARGKQCTPFLRLFAQLFYNLTCSHIDVSLGQVHAKGGWVWQMFTENNIEDNRTAGGPLGIQCESVPFNSEKG